MVIAMRGARTIQAASLLRSRATAMATAVAIMVMTVTALRGLVASRGRNGGNQGDGDEAEGIGNNGKQGVAPEQFIRLSDMSIALSICVSQLAVDLQLLSRDHLKASAINIARAQIRARPDRQPWEMRSRSLMQVLLTMMPLRLRSRNSLGCKFNWRVDFKFNLLSDFKLGKSLRCLGLGRFRSV